MTLSDCCGDVRQPQVQQLPPSQGLWFRLKLGVFSLKGVSVSSLTVPCDLVGVQSMVWCLRGAQNPQVRCSATLARLWKAGQPLEHLQEQSVFCGCLAVSEAPVLCSWQPGKVSSAADPSPQRQQPARQTSACFVSVFFRDAILWRQRDFSLPFSIFSWKWMLKGVVDSTFLSIFLLNFNKIPRNAACQCDSLLVF